MLFAQPEAQLIMPTVAEDIDLSLRRAAAVEGSALSGQQRLERIRELLRERGLEHLENQSVFTLSGGEKQLAGLSPVYWRRARRFFCSMSRPPCWILAQSRAAYSSIWSRWIRCWCSQHARPGSGGLLR